MTKTPTIGFGTMELCIQEDRPSLDAAQSMLQTLIEEHNLSFIDTADSYALNEQDFGYGERLVAPFIGRRDVTIATKGGFTRPDGKWVKRGDPAYIKHACEESLTRLGVDSLPLYQFHQPDPNVPFEETLGAFIELKEEGKVEKLGVSNFSLEQLTRACELTEIYSIQNPLSVMFYDINVHSPLLRYCEQHSITFIAYAPFGGHRNRGAIDNVDELQAFAQRVQMSVYEFALAFLQTVSPTVLAIPGTSNVQHAIANQSACALRLPEAIMSELMAVFAE